MYFLRNVDDDKMKMKRPDAYPIFDQDTSTIVKMSAEQ